MVDILDYLVSGGVQNQRPQRIFRCGDIGLSCVYIDLRELMPSSLDDLSFDDGTQMSRWFEIIMVSWEEGDSDTLHFRTEPSNEYGPYHGPRRLPNIEAANSFIESFIQYYEDSALLDFGEPEPPTIVTHSLAQGPRRIKL